MRRLGAVFHVTNSLNQFDVLLPRSLEKTFGIMAHARSKQPGAEHVQSLGGFDVVHRLVSKTEAPQHFQFPIDHLIDSDDDVRNTEAPDFVTEYPNLPVHAL